MDLKEGVGMWERSVGSRYGPMASGCCVHENAQFSAGHLMFDSCVIWWTYCFASHSLLTFNGWYDFIDAVSKADII